MSETHGAWLWYELMSADPAASKAFYEVVVGWNMSPGSPETGGDWIVQGIDPQGAMISLVGSK